jgi:hypothetical protein
MASRNASEDKLIVSRHEQVRAMASAFPDPIVISLQELEHTGN